MEDKNRVFRYEVERGESLNLPHNRKTLRIRPGGCGRVTHWTCPALWAMKQKNVCVCVCVYAFMYRDVENRVGKSCNEKVHRLKKRILSSYATYNIVVSFCEQRKNIFEIYLKC